MFSEFVKAMVVGVCAAVPIGPVLMLVLQKTMRRGRWAGTVTGLGSMLVDTLYAAIGFFALGSIQHVILRYEGQLMVAGGLLIVIIGILMFRKDQTSGLDSADTHFTMAGYAVQAAGCALSNPGAVVLVMAYLAIANLDAQTCEAPAWALLFFVAAGEFLYWFTLSALVGRYLRVQPRTLNIVSKAFGVLIAVVGTVLIVRGIIFLI